MTDLVAFPAEATEERRRQYGDRYGMTLCRVDFDLAAESVSYREVWGCGLESCRRCDVEIVSWGHPLTLDDAYTPIINGIDMSTPHAVQQLLTLLGFDLASRYYAMGELSFGEDLP